MSFYTGSAGSYAELVTAVKSACTANGWTLASGILSKGGCNALLSDTPVEGGNGPTYTMSGISLQIANSVASGALVNPPSMRSRIGTPTPDAFSEAAQIPFPLIYKIFVHEDPDEVYLIINYKSVYYQWLAFGKSPSNNTPGTGVWAGGTFGCNTAGPTISNRFAGDGAVTLQIGYSGGGGGNADSANGGLFFDIYGPTSGNYSPVHNCRMHTGQADNNNGFSQNTLGNSNPNASYGLGALMFRSPNAWNGHSALYPLDVNIAIPGSTVWIEIHGRIEHARYFSIANYQPGDIITLGSDKWQVFPWYKKGTTNVDGGERQDSGFMGWAIRYDGP